jgi:hypothetical protein
MFPNFRLIIGAVAASVVALSCGFGVFAALRVNHQPLARRSSATAPLQLVPDNGAPPAVPSARPSAADAPEIAAAAPDISPVESARNDGDQAPSAPSAAEPETAALNAEAKTDSATQPVDPPVTNSIALAADDHPPGAAEPVPAPVTTGSSAASVVPGEAAVAATGEEAKADKQAESASEPAPAAMPGVAAIERPATDQVVPEEQTWPVERIASKEQPATAQAAPTEQTAKSEQAVPVEETARLDQPAEAEQTARTVETAAIEQPARGEETAPAEQAASPNEAARAGEEDDASDTVPLPPERIARKKHAKTRIVAKVHHKHHTRVAARLHISDPFLQPHFVSAPRAFQSPAGPRRVKLTSRRTSSPRSAMGGPLVAPPGR